LLSSICVAASVEEIGANCFFRCTSLSRVTFEAGLRLSRLERGAFVECLLLSSICVPASVEEIGAECFFGCTSLSTVTFEPGRGLRVSGNVHLASVRPCLHSSFLLLSPILASAVSTAAPLFRRSHLRLALGSRVLAVGHLRTGRLFHKFAFLLVSKSWAWAAFLDARLFSRSPADLVRSP
jgi:hypothetical protein